MLLDESEVDREFWTSAARLFDEHADGVLTSANVLSTLAYVGHDSSAFSDAISLKMEALATAAAAPFTLRLEHFYDFARSSGINDSSILISVCPVCHEQLSADKTNLKGHIILCIAQQYKANDVMQAPRSSTVRDSIQSLTEDGERVSAVRKTASTPLLLPPPSS
eukprot:m.393893 g.393893  ORF g.393893 m.393893 type:complete len:165 (-) comp56365_c0_seq1:257-751(-)